MSSWLTSLRLGNMWACSSVGSFSLCDPSRTGILWLSRRNCPDFNMHVYSNKNKTYVLLNRKHQFFRICQTPIKLKIVYARLENTFK